MAQNTWFMVRLAWVSDEKKVLALSLLSALLAVTVNVVNLYVSPVILSAVERHAAASQLLMTIAGFVLGLMLVSAALAYVDANTLFGRVAVRREIINLLSKKAATTSYPNLDNDRFQKLAAKVRDCSRSNNASTEAIWITLTTLTTNLLGFVIYASLLAEVQPVMLGVILATTAAGYLLSRWLNGYEYRHREEAAQYQRQMDYLTTQAKNLTAAKDVRIFGLRPWLEELFGKTMGAYTAFHRRAQGVYLWGRIADLVLAFVRNAVAYWYLLGLVLRDGLEVSQFLLLFTAVGGFTQWVTGILEGFQTLQRQSLDLCCIREFLEFEEPFRFEGGAPLSPQPDRLYEIRLEDVSFRYPGAERDTLTHLNLTLHPGEKLAVVGLNGAGKTTLIKLICGFLDPTQGRVLLDGRDIREFNRRDYYAMFSAVFQDFLVLAGTVAANVAQTETEIDQKRVEECLQKAGLAAKIQSLPERCETYLNREVYEGAVLLSGGETQRLMLARALYKDAPFVILDEPTAALDPIAEAEMYEKYNEMTSGRSSVYISHRLASTRFCDRIILIAGGGIREEGTHQQLLQLGGSYAALYEEQSKYYREEEAKDGEE